MALAYRDKRAKAVCFNQRSRLCIVPIDHPLEEITSMTTQRAQFPNPPTKLLWKTPFELVVPLPLEECAKRLEAATSGETFYASRRGIRIYPLNSETLLFYLWQSGYRM